MITLIWLAAVLIIAVGAMLVYKSVGRRGQIAERQANASTQGASVGRATGSGDD